jgi:hypothetical protein
LQFLYLFLILLLEYPSNLLSLLPDSEKPPSDSHQNPPSDSQNLLLLLSSPPAFLIPVSNLMLD